MINEIVIGADPGQEGAIAVRRMTIRDCAQILETFRVTKVGYVGIAKQLEFYASTYVRIKCYFEDVHGRRGDFVNKAFEQGRHAGKLEVLFEVFGIPIEYVDSQVWQRHHGLGGIKDYDERKRKAKVKAQPIIDATTFPFKVTLEDADAILILRYGMMQELDV